MKDNAFKVGGLYTVNAAMFAYDDNPYVMNQRLTYKTITPKDAFIVLDYFLHSQGKSVIFILKVLFKDKIKFLVATENNLIEFKEN